MSKQRTIAFFLFVVFISIGFSSNSFVSAERQRVIEDSEGNRFLFTQAPTRIVSVVPTITDMIFALEAGDRLKGITYHSKYSRQAHSKSIVGGFFNPSLNRIAELKPELVFISQFHKKLRKELEEKNIRFVVAEIDSMEESYKWLRKLGKLLENQAQAEDRVESIKKQLALVAKKVAKIPKENRKRAMRLMGSNRVMTPGDDSFQNELIKAAGAIPPKLQKKGAIVEITVDEFRDFNPHVIYYCGSEGALLDKLKSRDGWKDVEAVKNGRFIRFPCDLTCRPSVNMGYFVTWLASSIYGNEFASGDVKINEDKELSERELSIKLDYVKSARIVDSRLNDFTNQTLVIDFKSPMNCISSLEGPMNSILTIGNHYIPPPLWNICHDLSIEGLKERVCGIIHRPHDKTAMLFTGARMDSLAVVEKSYEEMKVFALVTAGAETNAIRSSVDEGRFYEPATINIILLTNYKLTPRAMTRAIIAATEGKTAAIQDLDIRSSYTPAWQATGTGTDNIIIVQGAGKELDNAGGHSKLGELISKAVHDGVLKSLGLQNGMVKNRSIFQRLEERRLSPFVIAAKCNGIDKKLRSRVAVKLEELLMKPEYAGFMESAFAVSDSHENGSLHNLKAFQEYCRYMSRRIAGRETETSMGYLPGDFQTPAIRMALDSIINGIINAK